MLGTVQADVAMQPGRLSGFKSDPLENVKSDIKVSKRNIGKKKKKKDLKIESFKSWISKWREKRKKKLQDIDKIKSEDEINEGEKNEN